MNATEAERRRRASKEPEAHRSKLIEWLVSAGSSWWAARFFWPRVETWLTNQILRKIPGYRGTVGRVSLHPLPGTCIIQALSLDKVSGDSPLLSLRIPRIEFRFEWKYILKGCVMGEFKIDAPQCIFDLSVVPEDQKVPPPVRSDKETLQHAMQPRMEAMFPFCISRVLVRRGEVRLRNLSVASSIDLYADNISLVLKNITNSTAMTSTFMATAECRARVMSQGKVLLNAEAYPFAKVPTFNADFRLQGLDLRELAPVLESAMGVVITRGTAEVYAKGAAAEGKFRGYARPVLEDLEFERQKGRGLVAALKGMGAEAAMAIFRNKKTDSVATQVDFEGAFDGPHIHVTAAIFLFLKNAFFSALYPDLKHSLGFSRAGRKPSAMEVRYENTGKNRLWKCLELVKEAFSGWYSDQCTRMGASLAYYTAFSIAPLLILVIAVAGLLFGREAAQGQIVGQLGGLVGDQSAQAIQSMIQSAHHPSKGIFASIIGVVSLLVGASGIVSELKAALNRIWKTDDPCGLGALVKQNAKIYGIVLGTGFLLMVSLAVTAGLAAAGKLLGGALPIPEVVMHLFNFVLSFAVVTVLFACMFKFLPNTVIEWRDVWVGSAVTSFLFELGKFVLGLYLGKGTVGSSYGAAGSVLVALLWVYYSGLILYFGAEFTRAYAQRFGSRAHWGDKTVPLKKVD